MNNDLALVPARPRFQVDGRDAADLAAQLLKLDLRDDATGMARCEAEFGNWGVSHGQTGFLYFDRRLLDFGKAFGVRFGDVQVFDGRLMALNAAFHEGAPPTLRVLADDRLQDLRMTRRTRSFEDLTDADLVRSIANDHGLSPQVDLPGPTHRHLAQVNQSDLAFLHERLRAVDGELWLEGRTLHAQQRSARGQGGAELTLTHGTQLRRFDVTADLAGQRSAVTVSGWDVAGKQAIAETADAGALGQELGSDLSGIAILGSALAERKECLAHEGPLTGEQARAAAEGALRLTARRFVRGFGTAEPQAALRVGTRVKLLGLGPLFSGRYSVTAVRHRFDAAHGLRTEFHCERPGIGRP